MKKCFLGNRIVILGCPGSGKSTLAARLRALTGLPLLHLDNIWWKPDRTHISADAFDRELETLIKKDKWIIDGDYSRTYETRIRSCDTIVFLDLDEEECMAGIMNRIGKKRDDIPWVESRPDPGLEELVRGYHDQNRPKVYTLMEKYPDKQILIFRTRAQADEWISGFGRETE